MSNYENQSLTIEEVFEKCESEKMDFYHLAEACENKSQEEFTIELLAYIERNGRLLEIDEFTSYASLSKFIYQIDPIAIKEVEIFDCTTKYDHTTVFGVKIHLTTGVIKVVAHWCLWSGSNATFIFKGLFAPLLIAGLKEKVTFNGLQVLTLEAKDAYNSLFDHAVREKPEQFKMAPHDKLNDFEVNHLSKLTDKAALLPKSSATTAHIGQQFKEFILTPKR